MNKHAFVIATLAGLACNTHAQEAVPGEYLVKLREAPSARSQVNQFQAMADVGLDVVESVNSERGVFLARADSSLHAMSVRTLGRHPEVESIEPNYIWRVAFGSRPPTPQPSPTPTPRPTPRPTPTATPTPTPTPSPSPPAPPAGERASLPTLRPADSFFDKLWGLENLGQGGGTPYVDIWAPQAWKIFTGAPNFIVAVIDTGVEATHPDLQGNLVPGYSPYADNFDPKDENGHGTHCAGTIGGRGDNGIGVTGVNWNVKIMPIRFLAADGSGTTANAIKGIDWAVENGAKVLSNSWGGGGRSEQLYQAVLRARDKGVLFIAAAGNESNNNDAKPSYPASYEVDNVITVAASDKKEKLASFSNYGKKSVHLAAPGVDIYSTYKGGTYKSLSGTSMATPHVAGAAALVWGHRPEFNYLQVKAALLESVDRVAVYSAKTITGGRLNIYRALSR